MNAYCNGIAWREIDVEQLKEKIEDLEAERDHYRAFIERLIEFTKGSWRHTQIQDMCRRALEEPVWHYNRPKR